MPTYVYECNKCGDEFELYQSFADEPLKKHPDCGGKVAKVFQPVGIVLKGSGFYKNDSRNGSKRSNGSSGKDTAENGSKDTSKSDSSSASTKTETSGSKQSDGSSSSGSSAKNAKKKSESSTSSSTSS